MRAICESCSQPQPRDWQPGHLCVHCGLAVRQEVRCFWCVKWTPLAKYCRKCGADVLEDPSMFGAARMLKDAGADRFAIPKMLREFYADRIDTFRAIYQTQAAVVAAHVADAEYVETFLHRRVWSGEIEDQLIAQLPWPEGSQLPLLPDRDEDRLAQIAKLTPVAMTAALASIALYSRGDWHWQPQVVDSLVGSDTRVAEEAALALTHWRAMLETRFPRQFLERIENLLLQSECKQEAAVRLTALFPEKYKPDSETLASPNADIRFAAALNARNIDTLRAAANSDEGTRYAAILALADSGHFDATLPIGELEDDQIVSVLDVLSRKKRTFPQLTDTLLNLMKANADASVRNRVARILALDISAETALAIFQVDPKDRDTATILLRSNMPPETFANIGARLIDEGLFSASMYGMDDAAKPGRMPEAFVPANYARADARQRCELIRFAEHQLEARECSPLKDFLSRKCFEEVGRPQHDAWSSMSRLVRRESYTAVCPFALSTENVNRVFGSMDGFLPILIHFLTQTDWRDDVIIFDPVSRFLRYTEDTVWQALCDLQGTLEFIEVIVQLIDDETLRGSVQNDAFYPLIGIAAACPKLRSSIETSLRRFAQEGSKFQMAADYALRRIEQLTGRPADMQSDPQDPASTSSVPNPRASTTGWMPGFPRYSNEEE